MDPMQESLLSAAERGTNSSMRSNGNQSKWRKNLFLLGLTLSIAVCLTVYFYLNMVAIDGNQSDPNRYKPLSRRKPMLDHESIFSDSGPSMIKLSDLLAHCLVALKIAGDKVVDLSLAHNDKIGLIGSKGKTLEGADDIVTGVDVKSHQLILSTIKDSYRRLNVVSEEDTTSMFDGMTVEDDILPIDRVEFANLLRNNLHEIEGPHPDRGSLISQEDTLVWIDPLDATKEYSENLTNYVTLMACIVHKSMPIAGVIHKPFTNETYWSMEDTSTGTYHHSPELSKSLISKDNLKRSNESVRIIVSRSHAGNVKKVLAEAYGERAEIISAGGSGYKTVELVSGKVDAYIHMTRIKKWDICAPHAIINSIPGGRMTDLDGNKITFGDAKAKQVDSGLVASLDSRIFEELIKLVGTKM